MFRDRKLALNTLVVSAAFAVDKGLAVLRDLVIGRRFGAGYEYDAYSAAIQGPELLFTLIAGGALAAAFIPVLSEYITGRDREERWKLASAIMNIVILILLAAGLVVGLLAEPICAHWLTPDYSLEKQLLTARLLRIMLIQTFIFGSAGVVVGILHAHQHFFFPAIAPLFYNLGQIAGAVLLAPRMGIAGLTWGMVLGAAAYLAIQLPVLVSLKARYFPTLGLRMDGVRKVGLLMAPRLVSLGLVELADVFFVRLGSRLPDGHLSAYFWGWRIMQLPETLFGTAVAQVFFPTFAELASSNKLDELREKANASLRIILTLTIPSAAALVLLGKPVISLIGGAFDEKTVSWVYAALSIFSLRLVGEAVLEIGARLFYARQDTVTPMFTAAAGQFISILMGYLLIDSLGFRGLVIATTVGFWVESICLLVLIQLRLGGILDGKLWASVLRALAGTIVLGLTVYGVSIVLPAQGGLIQIGLAAATAMAAGTIVYIAVLWITGSPELRAIPQLIKKPDPADDPAIQ